MTRACLAVLALAVAACGALTPHPDEATAFEAVPAVLRTGPRLVGFGCGPDRLTLYAEEEDEFIYNCEAIERLESYPISDYEPALEI